MQRVTKLRLLKDVSAHHQRVASVTFKDIRGPNAQVYRLALDKILFYYLMLLWNYLAESRVDFGGVGRGLVEHVT
jgi:abortive infection bacteriophage resistance protein